MNKVKRVERGWAGHFIGSGNCMFRRNTLLEYNDIKIVVSTVGAYYVNNKFQEIGANRYYETMAFHTDKEDDLFNDADVSKQIFFETNWGVNEMKTGADNRANEMHENVVDEIIEKLEKGKTFICEY